jgi:hypothetical protein
MLAGFPVGEELGYANTPAPVTRERDLFPSTAWKLPLAGFQCQCPEMAILEEFSTDIICRLIGMGPITQSITANRSEYTHLFNPSLILGPAKQFMDTGRGHLGCRIHRPELADRRLISTE